MSLYNVLRTGVSGMSAQATKLGTVADNIANANTVGYKRADAEFSSLILESGPSSYSSGAVTSKIRYNIAKEGALTYTLSQTDIAIKGDGFFIVQDRMGNDFLTRAGSFVVDGQTGHLVNAAGFALLGYPSVPGVETPITLNDTGGLIPISMDYMNMRATPSTAGTYRSNVDADAPVVAAPTAGDNAAGSGFSVKNSMVAYDDLGRAVTLDVYWTKTADYDPAGPTEAVWEVVVFDQSTEDPSTTATFPYTSPEPVIGGSTPADPVLARATMTFNPSTGAITNITTLVPATGYSGPVDPTVTTQRAVLEIQMPNSTNPLALDVTGTTQLGANFQPLEIAINGNAPAIVKDVAMDDEGRVYAVYEDGTEVEFYRLPLANVPSPDQLKVLSANVYAVSPQSGTLRVALPDEGGNGSLVVGALEQSNVDLATELTEMIIAQRSYTANSKSFQTGNELLEVLVNLKR